MTKEAKIPKWADARVYNIALAIKNELAADDAKAAQDFWAAYRQFDKNNVVTVETLMAGIPARLVDEVAARWAKKAEAADDRSDIGGAIVQGTMTGATLGAFVVLPPVPVPPVVAAKVAAIGIPATIGGLAFGGLEIIAKIGDSINGSNAADIRLRRDGYTARINNALQVLRENVTPATDTAEPQAGATTAIGGNNSALSAA